MRVCLGVRVCVCEGYIHTYIYKVYMVTSLDDIACVMLALKRFN